MKINSELPLCMLSCNNQLNEYDFVLFHLYESNQSYKEYFLNQRANHQDRIMIFDNSAYEYYIKGEKLDIDKYFEAICELKPDYYILPDVLMDKEKTINGVKDFINNYKGKIKQSYPLAVIQGNSIEELKDCINIYREMDICNIAIPFHNSFFKDMVVDSDVVEYISKYYIDFNEDVKYAMGRMQFVKNIYLELYDFDYVHLLGSHCPFEKGYYNSMIDSIDTGYPVKCAMMGYVLGEEPCKPNIIIDEFLNENLGVEVVDLISNNVSIFKEL